MPVLENLASCHIIVTSQSLWKTSQALDLPEENSLCDFEGHMAPKNGQINNCCDKAALFIEGICIFSTRRHKNFYFLLEIFCSINLHNVC